MGYFNIELIDVSEAVANFKFTKVSKENLTSILNSFKQSEAFLEFQSNEGHILLQSKYFRGIMFTEHVAAPSLAEENKESAVEVSKVKLKKSIFSNPEAGALPVIGDKNGTQA